MKNQHKHQSYAVIKFWAWFLMFVAIAVTFALVVFPTHEIKYLRKDNLNPLALKLYKEVLRDPQIDLFEEYSRHEIRDVVHRITADGNELSFLRPQLPVILNASVHSYIRNLHLPILGLTIGALVLSALLFSYVHLKRAAGINNDNIYLKSHSSNGWLSWALGIILIAFYIVLYWYPFEFTNLFFLVSPASVYLRGKLADQWFLYGTLYTVAVTVMGIRMFVKYRHSRYHLIRTASIIFFQGVFAYFIPSLLESLNEPAMDLKLAWPLDYNYFAPYKVTSATSQGDVAMMLFVWGIILSLVILPYLTYRFGKRWYCSWVCGCGGLAETLGDPFRQLSNKSVKAWKIERYLIYSILVLVVLMTLVQLVNYFSGGSALGGLNWRFSQIYGFVVGSIFAGVIGTGFYPLMGSRVWCRFGCPLAAIMGIIQKFKSRFVITTNSQQCISCGNCSTYCEMGIDVRWYAQRGQNIVRASCVGCGVCSAVCPRGVLKLENTTYDRYNTPREDELLAEEK